MNNLQYIIKDNTRFAIYMAVELCEQGDFNSPYEAIQWLMQEHDVENNEKFCDATDYTHGTLTAEQVMAIVRKHQPDYCSDTHVCFDWQAIADELNASRW